MDFRLELVPVPVADVDRAIAFYTERAGFRVEQDVRVDDTHRFVELTPPGSPCSIALTTGYVDAEPGTVKGLQLNVDDALAARALLQDRGVDVTGVETHPWGRFCWFSDPDGNQWTVHGPAD